ncbi:hypothetical protein PLICRDRAFT_59034, partial [Plicaturopsis crispa FD-325 SS-3]
SEGGHKLPDDWEKLCECSFCRLAYSIKEEDIPPSLYVNSDQTQAVFAQGSKLTWAPTGAKQVSVVGEDEKRAFTVLVSISNDGAVLPFQAIYSGYTERSCPNRSARNYGEAESAGFCFECSETDNYWSTQKTMRSFVDKILAPYFSSQKQKLGLPQTQKSLWQIDVWSVHRSDEFRTWMRKTHPTIILDFIPAGTT